MTDAPSPCGLPAHGRLCWFGEYTQDEQNEKENALFLNCVTSVFCLGQGCYYRGPSLPAAPVPPPVSAQPWAQGLWGEGWT